MRLCFALVLFVASVSIASAKDVVRANPTEFPALRAKVDMALQSDEYSELTHAQRAEVVAALDRMEKTLTGLDSVDRLNVDQRTRLLNDQELVNTVLTKAAADSRTVCRVEAKTGSHRTRQVCRTVAEIRREREEAANEWNKLPLNASPPVQ